MYQDERERRIIHRLSLMIVGVAIPCGWKVASILGTVWGVIVGVILAVAQIAFFVSPIPDKIDKFIRVKVLKKEHESGLEREEWDRRQAERQRVEELEARLQSRHHTNAEIDYLIRTAPLWDKNKKMLREKYLGKKKP